MKKKSLKFVVLSVIIMLLAACSQQATPEPVAEQPVAEQPATEQPAAEQPAAEQPAAETLDPNRELNIIAVQHAECSWDSFWCTVQAGIEQSAMDNNVNVTILAPDEFDLDKTASLIEQAVAANPDAIMLTVTD
ncbi:MAG: hypothetical protein CVU40_14225, partial [Chloroflexi bacterium HGW-Chloroflexi-2]